MLKHEDLKTLQNTELEIAKKIRDICEKYSLEYYLIGGTLLGAVRHGGFIPWDDDMDIVMPREDYEKFIQICSTELDEGYYLQSYRTDENYWLSFSKLRKNNTIFVERDVRHMESHKGIFVDIFPLDYSNVYIGSILKLKYKIFKYLRYLVGYKLGLHENKEMPPISLRNKVIITLVRPMKANILLRIQQWLVQRGGRRKKYFVNYGSQYGIAKQTMSVDKYRPGTTLTFEGEVFSVPRDYKYVLTRIYGEKYMELPPKEKRVTHSPVDICFDVSARIKRTGI